jgi:hypothetical protein
MQGCEGQGAEARKAVEGGGDDGGAVLAPCGAREVEVGESKLREGGKGADPGGSQVSKSAPQCID